MKCSHALLMSLIKHGAQHTHSPSHPIKNTDKFAEVPKLMPVRHQHLTTQSEHLWRKRKTSKRAVKAAGILTPAVVEC